MGISVQSDSLASNKLCLIGVDLCGVRFAEIR